MVSDSIFPHQAFKRNPPLGFHVRQFSSKQELVQETKKPPQNQIKQTKKKTNKKTKENNLEGLKTFSGHKTTSSSLVFNHWATAVRKDIYMESTDHIQVHICISIYKYIESA